jgi:hypothetical protein
MALQRPFLPPSASADEERGSNSIAKRLIAREDFTAFDSLESLQFSGTAHTVQMGEMENTYKIFVGKP